MSYENGLSALILNDMLLVKMTNRCAIRSPRSLRSEYTMWREVWSLWRRSKVSVQYHCRYALTVLAIKNTSFVWKCQIMLYLVTSWIYWLGRTMVFQKCAFGSPWRKCTQLLIVMRLNNCTVRTITRFSCETRFSIPAWWIVRIVTRVRHNRLIYFWWKYYILSLSENNVINGCSGNVAMFYLGQSYSGQFLLRPVLLRSGST